MSKFSKDELKKMMFLQTDCRGNLKTISLEEAKLLGSKAGESLKFAIEQNININIKEKLKTISFQKAQEMGKRNDKILYNLIHNSLKTSIN